MAATTSVSLSVPGTRTELLRRLPVLLDGRPFHVRDDRRVEIREGAEKRISVRLVAEGAHRHDAAQPSQRAVLTFEGYARTEIRRLVARFSDATGDSAGRVP